MTRFNAITAAGTPTVQKDPVDTIALLKSSSISGFSGGEARLVQGYYAAGDGGGGEFRYNAASSATDNGGSIIAPNAGSGRWERIIEQAGYVHVAQFGAVGSGSDETAKIDAAVHWLSRGVVEFDGAKTYVVKKRNNSLAGYQQGAVLHKEGHDLKGNGCTLRLQDNAVFIQNDWYDALSSPSTVTADVTYGALTLTLDSAAQFTAGDKVFVRLGTNAYDSTSPNYTVLANIRSIASNVITLDTPILKSLTASTTGAADKVVHKVLLPMESGSVDGFYLWNDIANGGNAEGGVELRYTKNITISNLKGVDTGIHVIVGYSDNVHVENIGVDRAIMQGGQASKGRIFGVYNSFNVHFDGVYGRDFEGSFCFVESYARSVKATNVHVVNSYPTRANSTTAIFFVGQEAECDFDAVFIEGKGNFGLVDDGGTPARYTMRNLTLRTDTVVKGSFVPKNLQGKFVFHNAQESYETFHCNQVLEHSLFIPLVDNMVTATFYLPAGLWVGYTTYASSAVVSGDIIEVYIARPSSVGANVNTQFVAGQESIYDNGFGSDYPREMLYTERTRFIVSTAATGVSNLNKFIVFRLLRFAPASVSSEAFSSTEARIRQNGLGSSITDADTTSATLTQLETEVNKLKAVLRTYGVISY